MILSVVTVIITGASDERLSYRRSFLIRGWEQCCQLGFLYQLSHLERCRVSFSFVCLSVFLRQSLSVVQAGLEHLWPI